MSMIRDDPVELFRFAQFMPGRGANLEHELVTVSDGGVQWRWLVHHVPSVGAGYRVPPHVPEKQNCEHRERSPSHRCARPDPLLRRNLLARCKLAFTNSRPNNGN